MNWWNSLHPYTQTIFIFQYYLACLLAVLGS